ncbi:SRF-type transcription factor RlmA [Diplocarpon rosae]|nr:SRF-type transcription factor RlmA [Diplocarpon rosae]
MGRRKIEIKAIKDDRNRSVTFLKRKGGLFKKAHELSVLCSVDVAVVIFGNNKKLYEYSSSDIGEIMTRYQYYGVANEHKGPADFDGKGKLDDDDDEEEGSVPSHHGSVEPQMMPPHFQNQANFQHIRHHTPSASPPIANIVFPHHPQQQRQHTPQPQSGSRPSSRNAMHRTSSNLVQQQQQQQQQQHHAHPMPPNGYAYMPNHPAMYNPPNGSGLPPHPHGLPQHMQQAPPRSVGVSHQPQYPNYGQPPAHPQQHPYPQQSDRTPDLRPSLHKRRSRSRSISRSISTSISISISISCTGSRRRRRTHSTPPPPHPDSEGQHPAPQQMLEPVKRMSTKSRSIFTPIDESRSILSQHWASSTTNVEPNRADAPPHFNGLAPSVDLAALGGIKTSTSPPPPLVRDQSHHKTLSLSSVSLPEDFPTPSRSNAGQLGGGKRPVLKVHIPDEPSEGDSSSSPRSGNAAGPPAPDTGHANADSNPSVVLPPPSPSASALLSAGASGPPNPFARPHPPQANANNGGGNTTTTTTTTTHHNSSNNDNSNNSNHNINNNSINIDTPASALPSRFMTNEFLPSPTHATGPPEERGRVAAAVSQLWTAPAASPAAPVPAPGPAHVCRGAPTVHDADVPAGAPALQISAAAAAAAAASPAAASATAAASPSPSRIRGPATGSAADAGAGQEDVDQVAQHIHAHR